MMRYTMKLDASFAREIKKVNGDGSREAKFEFLTLARATAQELSDPAVMKSFGDVLAARGRAAVGVCVAVTVVAHQDRLEAETVQWGREVLKLWTNGPHDPYDVLIRDGLHPTRIEEYAGSFIRLTTEEA